MDEGYEAYEKMIAEVYKEVRKLQTICGIGVQLAMKMVRARVVRSFAEAGQGGDLRPPFPQTVNIHPVSD